MKIRPCAGPGSEPCLVDATVDSRVRRCPICRATRLQNIRVANRSDRCAREAAEEAISLLDVQQIEDYPLRLDKVIQIAINAA